MHFCEYFPKSSVEKFQKILMRASGIKFREFWVENSSFVLLNVTAQETISLNFWR